jgi:hypothetical protein
MYRNDEVAAEERIASLEDRLSAQAHEIAELRADLKRRDARIGALITTFNGTARSAYRAWRAVAIGSVVALVVMLFIAEFRVRAAQDDRLAPRVILADPVDEKLPNHSLEPSSDVDAPAAKSVADVPLECAPSDPLC